MGSVLKYWFIALTAAVFACSDNKKLNDLLPLDSNEFNQYFNSKTDSHSILLETNLNIKALSSDTTWCKTELRNNNDKKNLVIFVTSNDAKESRSAEIILENKGKKLAGIQILQLGSAPGILIKEDTAAISDELNFKVDIVTNIPLEFDLPEWIKYNPAEENENQSEYSFTAKKLPEKTEERRGVITAKGIGENSKLKVSFSVWQTKGLPRFAVISDIIIGRGDSKEKLKKKLLCLLNTPKAIDALFIVGDLTGRGAAAQYEDLKNICDSLVSAEIPIYFMMGNTDYYAEKSELAFQKELNQPFQQYFSIKNYPFITLSMSGIYTDRFTQSDKDFLLNSLQYAEKEYPGKPIFFFTHIGTSNTFYGTEKNGANLGSQVLEPILEQFPQIITFSGHTNFPLGDPRSIHQGKFTSVGIGAGVSSRIENGYTEGLYPPNYDKVSEGLIVSVQKNGDVEIERWDTYRNEEIFPKWTVKAPHDGTAFHYAGRTGGTAPFFTDDAHASIIIAEDNSCAVVFPQAEDDEIVHHYIIEVTNSDTLIFRNTRFSQFYLNNSAPEEFKVKLFGLPADIPLSTQIKAVDSYNNTSAPLVSETFVFKDIIPGENVRLPQADLFDIRFDANGIAKDISPNKVPVEPGATSPKTYFNETFDRYVAQFNGPTSFYKVDYTNNTPIKNAISENFSLETVYMPHNLNNMAPLSGKEWEGLGIEQENGGQIEFWAYLNDKYIKAKSSVFVKPEIYYHVVAAYDRNSEKMTIYINGKKAGEAEASGNLLMPKRLDSRWFCIGGDTHPSGTVQHALNGEVVLARMYSSALSNDEVYLLYQNLNNNK